MTCRLVSALAFSALSAWYATAAVDVTLLGAKNDGSADVSDIVNEATVKDALFFPAGVYKVAKPLRLRNSVRGAGFARVPYKVDASRTWLVSAIPDEGGLAGVIEFADNTSATVEDLSIRCNGAVNGIRIANCTQGMMLDIRRLGIFDVSSCGLFVEGSGSRTVFAGDLTIWGEPASMSRSVAIRLGGACDCRLSNIEMMGAAVGIEAYNGHTYGSNLHIWTGFLGGKRDPNAWWKQTRSIVLGRGSNFSGSNVYPDTSYYAIEFRESGAVCEINNIMYWEDGSVDPVKDRKGAFLCPDAAGDGRLIVHGGLVGVSGTDAKPGAMSRVYSPRQTFAGVMMKCAYSVMPENLDRLCLGGDLPDYSVSYRTNAFCKVADILTPVRTGSCEAKVVRDDGAAWCVGVVKSATGVDACVRAVNALGTDADVRMVVMGDHVKVFLRAPADAEKGWTARFTTSHMGDYCRPLDHGSLRDMGGRVRYREYLPSGSLLPRIIFDTDMITDFDDIGALACLHAMADTGECEILATVSSTRGNASVAAIEVVNGYYGRGDLPVGAPKGMGVMGAYAGAKVKVDPKSPLVTSDVAKRLHEGDHYKYRKLAADYPQWVKHLDADDAPDANLVYRRALASVPDKSVVICSVGFLTNLRRLLETKADDISPLDGRTLVERKVKRLVAMACAYPKGCEYNAMWDAESSRIVFDRWPTEIVFSDWQYGGDLFAGRAIAEMSGSRNPVKDVFSDNMPSREDVSKDVEGWRKKCFGLAGRSAWDETAVLAAVRGTDGYFGVQRGEYRIVDADGTDEWMSDEGKGPHLRLTEKTNKVEIGKIIDELICRKPPSHKDTD